MTQEQLKKWKAFVLDCKINDMGSCAECVLADLGRWDECEDKCLIFDMVMHPDNYHEETLREWLTKDTMKQRKKFKSLMRSGSGQK